MTITQRLVREPVLVLGVITAGLSLAVLFGAPITAEQIAGVGLAVGAVLALLRGVLTPSSEVLAQLKPDGTVVAGPASASPTGAPVAGRATVLDETLLEVPVDNARLRE